MIIITFLKDDTDHSFSCLPIHSDQHNLIIRIGIGIWILGKIKGQHLTDDTISLLWIKGKIQYILKVNIIQNELLYKLPSLEHSVQNW